MRKRTEVKPPAAPPADTRTEAMFREPSAAALPGIPPRTEKPPRSRAAATGLAFATCPGCGLQQSAGTTEKSDGKCMRCDVDMGAAAGRKHDDEADAAVNAEAMGAITPDERDAVLEKLPQTKVAAVPRPPQDAPVAPGAAKPKYDPNKPLEPACCPTCAKPMVQTALGPLPGCGCPAGGAKPKPKVDEYIVPLVAGQVPDSVTVTWGEEMLKIADFCNARVGPFSATVVIAPGEAIAQAARRVNEELRRFAEAERERKVESFKLALKKATGQ